MTYSEFISKFSIVDNPSEQSPDGFHYHHIVPRSIQEEIDNRCILLKYSEHAYAHWLFDKENKTNTSSFFIGRINKKASEIDGYDDFKVLDTQSWNSDNTRIKMSNKAKVRLSIKENNPMYGKHFSEESRKKLSDANKGTKPWNTGYSWSEDTKDKIRQSVKENSGAKGKHWFHNGEIQILAFDCPEGFVSGKSPSVVKKTGNKLKGRIPWNKGLKSYN